MKLSTHGFRLGRTWRTDATLETLCTCAQAPMVSFDLKCDLHQNSNLENPSLTMPDKIMTMLVHLMMKSFTNFFAHFNHL